MLRKAFNLVRELDISGFIRDRTCLNLLYNSRKSNRLRLCSEPAESFISLQNSTNRVDLDGSL